MTVHELLEALPPIERARLLGQLEGMQFAQRIAKNRADDIRADLNRSMEAVMCAELIRLVQVGIGAGRMPFPELTPDELDALWRIY